MGLDRRGSILPRERLWDNVDIGVLGVGGIGLSIGDSGLNIGAELFGSQNNRSDNDFEKTSPFGVMGLVGYDFGGPDGDSSPYVFGQLGVLVQDAVPSGFLSRGPDSGLALGAGAGYYFPLSRSLRGKVEGRFTQASIDGVNTSFFGIVAYISVKLGD